MTDPNSMLATLASSPVDSIVNARPSTIISAPSPAKIIMTSGRFLGGGLGCLGPSACSRRAETAPLETASWHTLQYLCRLPSPPLLHPLR